MQDNPYQSPSTTPDGSTGFENGSAVNRNTVEMLARTRPWVLFLAILGFICCGLMVLSAFSMMVLGSQMTGAGAAAGSAMMMPLCVFYIVLAAIYLLPTIKMMKYSSAINTLKYSPTVEALDNALDRQRSFWKTMGIFMIVMIVLWVVLMIAIAGMRAATMRSFQ